MTDSEEVKGLAELGKFLDTLPAKLQQNVVRGALRAGMKTVLPVARDNIHNVSGELAKGLRIGTRSQGDKVTAYIRVRGKHSYVARWVEFGTKAHPISGKLGGSLFFGGLFVKSVNHPGSKPHPFLRPALDQQVSAAPAAVATYMKERLATKHGLDTAAVDVGEERA